MQNSVFGIIHNGKIEPTEPVAFPEGTRVLVTPLPAEKPSGNAIESTQERRLGTLQGTVQHIAPDFDAPLDDFQEYMP